MTKRLRYPEAAPDGYAALSGFGHYVNTGTALSPVLLGFVYLRASVLNGCNFCTEMHSAELRKHHEPETRILAVRDVPEGDLFTPRELAALRWTDELTHLRPNGESASDGAYEAVSAFFQGKELADLTFAIANINAWNRMGVAFRPEWRPHGDAGKRAPGMGDPQKQSGTAQATTAETKPDAKPAQVDVTDDDGGKAGQD